jgi:acetyl-CoA C-acetyltransferase
MTSKNGVFSEPIALYAGVRTAIGKLGGVFSGIEPHQLLASSITGTLIRSLSPNASSLQEVEEARIALQKSTPDFDEALIGNVRNSIGNIARVGVLEAGLPLSTPAITVDRQCASSLECVALAAGKLLSGQANRVLVGGVESASQAPWLYAKTSRAYSYFEPAPFRIRMAAEHTGDPSMGETAELLADEFGISRESMDSFAAASHQRAAKAQAGNGFQSEIWGYRGTLRALLSPSEVADECVRPDSTPESLAKLKPVFRPKVGRVTAGNSSPLNDAAVSAIAVRATDLPEDQRANAMTVHAISTVALDPTRMGLGPALAIPRLLETTGLSLDQIDLVEINEAFAGQLLACLLHMEQAGVKIPLDKLNVNGGAIALGHPLGATGLRLLLTLGNALRQRNLRRGIASLCVGGGQGMAALIEIE